MIGKKALRVAVGPVQGFISSGRRTRDFWAGSFLLSWLSGVAMKTVIDAGGKITIPAVYGEDGKISEPTLRAPGKRGAGSALSWEKSLTAPEMNTGPPRQKHWAMRVGSRNWHRHFVPRRIDDGATHPICPNPVSSLSGHS